MKKMRKSIQRTNRIMSLLLAVVLIFASIRPIAVNAMEANSPVEKVDFKDFSNWRSGNYNWTTGIYSANSARLCLNEYVTVSSGQYRVYVNNSNYHLLIRELDRSRSFIKSCELLNGKVYIPSANAYYLAIGIYKANGESGVTYSTYKQLFTNGFYAGLQKIQTEEEDTETSSSDTQTETENKSESIEQKIYSAEAIDYKNFSNWRSGTYDYIKGQYCASKARICLNDYVTVNGGEYNVCVKNSSYCLLIRELDKNKTFIKSYALTDGKSYAPSTNTAYLGISIYKMNGESNVSYDTYKSLFANGFYAGLEVVEEEEVEEEEEKELDNGSSNDTTETSDSQAVYDLLKKAMLQSDGSKFDISKYKLSVDEVENVIWKKVIDDNYLEYVAQNGIRVCVIPKNGYAYQFYLLNINADYENCLKKVKASVNKYLDQVDNKMTDVEKVLLAHEFIVDNTQYKAANSASYRAAGPLADGYGVCAGYSGAMITLLHFVGIEAYEVIGQGMNHEWIYVKLDGEYYHIDPTWDDTRKGTDAVYQHRFLIRNDDEFSTISAGEVHRNWFSNDIDTVKCSSQRFTNWYVHDVAGSMHYYNGMWYYRDVKTNSIKCGNISGSVQRVVVDGATVSGTVKIKGIDDGVLSYYVGSTLCTKNL